MRRFICTCILVLVLLCSISPSRPAAVPSNIPSAKTAQDFFVDGKHIPGLDFAVNDSYAGLLPVSTASDRNVRELFFWWYPAEGNLGKDDLVIWINGGPGCSSFFGLVQENGPWLFPKKAKKPIPNPFSWHKLSNVLWVDQPVGTGLSTGKPAQKNDAELAIEFYNFLIQFFATFPQLKGKKLWISGESYAGQYIPYIVSQILLHKDESIEAGINFQSFNLVDPYIDRGEISVELPSIEFAVSYQEMLELNTTFINYLVDMAKGNDTYNYVKKNLLYPRKEPLKIPDKVNVSTYDPWGEIVDAANLANDCFDLYSIQIKNLCANTTIDPLGYTADGPSANNFINNVTGFKEYIHADPNTTFYSCAIDNVYVGEQDPSPEPGQSELLQYVIEHSPVQRSMIQHGELDFRLLADGVALTLQNTTWNGLRGFQHPPSKALIVDAKRHGVVQNERGLTFVRVSTSGHMIPTDVPNVSFKLQKYWLGQISLEDLFH